jgi:hypothetical protein
LAVVVLSVLLAAGCGGGSGSGAATEAPSERAACEQVWGDVLLRMRSFMAEVAAGMTVGTFALEYPKLAGPMQLARDASRGSDCPSEINASVELLYRGIKQDSQDDSTIRRWNRDYKELQARIAALP